MNALSRPTNTSRAFRSMALIMLSAAFDAAMGFIPLDCEVWRGGAPTPEFPEIFVAIAPGKTTVTRTFVPINSDARPSDMSFTPAFAAQYIVCPGTGTKPPMLDTLTICPSGLMRSCGRNALMT